MYVMQRLSDGLYFVRRRPNTGLGDLMTAAPQEAALYNHATPMGFTGEWDAWVAVSVCVRVSLASYVGVSYDTGVPKWTEREVAGCEL